MMLFTKNTEPGTIVQYVGIRRNLFPFLIGSLLVFAGCERLVSDDIPAEPVTLESLIDEGMTAFEAGDMVLAIERLTQALERDVDPNNALAAYQGLGWAYSRVNSPNLAINTFNFILSIESINSGKIPVVEREGVSAVSAPVLADPAVADTFGIGRWAVTISDPEAYLLAVTEISSYSAEYRQKFQVGQLNNRIEPGTEVIGLDKSPLSNSAGVGMAGALSASLTFSKDTLNSAVASASEISTYSDYFIDVDNWEIQIMPRYWEIAGLTADYLYFEDTYRVNSYGFKTISLGETLDDGNSSGIPVLVPVSYPGGRTFYVAGRFFNKAEGGTHNMADAYAGIAAAYFSRGDYREAIEAGNAAILINEYLSQTDASYVYQRQLFQSDDEVGLWEIYHLMAAAYLKIKDFHNAFDYIEKLGAAAPDPETSPKFVYEALVILGSLEKDSSWQPPQLW